LDLLNSISDRIPHSERHESLLARGYVVVRNGVARVLTEAAEISAGDPLDLEFYDGRVGVPAPHRGKAADATAILIACRLPPPRSLVQRQLRRVTPDRFCS
jgi:hypothetical protein